MKITPSRSYTLKIDNFNGVASGSVIVHIAYDPPENKRMMVYYPGEGWFDYEWPSLFQDSFESLLRYSAEDLYSMMSGQLPTEIPDLEIITNELLASIRERAKLGLLELKDEAALLAALAVSGDSKFSWQFLNSGNRALAQELNACFGTPWYKNVLMKKTTDFERFEKLIKCIHEGLTGQKLPPFTPPLVQACRQIQSLCNELSQSYQDNTGLYFGVDIEVKQNTIHLTKKTSVHY